MLYAHQRWTIEHFHWEAKQYLGINEFQGRTWDGCHRHVTMVLLAYAFLSSERALSHRPEDEPLPPLVAEIAHAVTREVYTQTLKDEMAMDRAKAEEAPSIQLRVLFARSDD